MNAGSHHLTASFLSRQLQLSNLPVYKLCQIVTMQPMWCMGKNHQFSIISLSNTIVLLRNKQVTMPCAYGKIKGTNAGSDHLTALVWSKQLHANNLPVYALLQCNLCGATQISTFACLILLVCVKGWRKVMQLEYGEWCRFAPFRCYTSSRQLLQNKLPAYTLWLCNPCGAIQTSTRICSIPLVYRKVGRKSCS